MPWCITIDYGPTIHKYLSQLSMLEKQYRDELNMEFKGINYSASLPNRGSSDDNVVEEDTTTTNLEQIAEDAQNRSKISMSRKKRKIYEAMQVMILSQLSSLSILLNCEVFYFSI